MCLDISKKSIQDIKFSKNEVSFETSIVNGNVSDIKLSFTEVGLTTVVHISEDSMRDLHQAFTELIQSIDHSRIPEEF